MGCMAFTNAMQLINNVNDIQNKAIFAKNQQSHGLLGNVNVITHSVQSMDTDHDNKDSEIDNNKRTTNPPTKNTTSNNNSKPHECPFETCPKSYKSRSSLNAHLPSHELEDDYETTLLEESQTIRSIENIDL